MIQGIWWFFLTINVSATTIIKKHGALLAKGRLLGIQFNELFKDNLVNDEQIKKLDQKVSFSYWEKYDDTHTAIRFATA